MLVVMAERPHVPSSLFIPEPPDLREQRRVREARIIKNLKTCVWPLCDKAPDRDLRSPLCHPHGLRLSDDYRQQSLQASLQHYAMEAARRPPDPVRIAQTTGQIYYIRLNDVIKVGWSRQLQGRLHDYGAGAELLAHHPGSRADERDLHRGFKPLLVHGREWYRGDAQILLDHIAAVLAEHGPPKVSIPREVKSSQVSHKRHRAQNGSWMTS